MRHVAPQARGGPSWNAHDFASSAFVDASLLRCYCTSATINDPEKPLNDQISLFNCSNLGSAAIETLLPALLNWYNCYQLYFICT
mmetsp:Transcript_45876/g.96319  ORF Transcript_45876/g.96319 Transcript_45876/m.96319 type:complete len:85 (+) Transcript_45876:4773-5027(+)